MTKLLPGKDNEANIEAFKKMHAADPAIGTVDMKVKNIGHPSYVPILDYWIYFDNAILNEDNEEKEERSSQPRELAATEPAAAAGERDFGRARGDYRLRLTYDAEGFPIGSDGKRLQTMYRGHQLTEIRDNIVTLLGGKPEEGDRNRRTYRVLSSMAPIVDYREEVLQTLIPYWGLTWDEVEQVASSASKRRSVRRSPICSGRCCTRWVSTTPRCRWTSRMRMPTCS